MNTLCAHTETLSWPFTISCRDRKENEIYWYVVEEGIYGTIEAKLASKFYIKYLPGGSSQFCIIYQKAPRIASFVTFKEKVGLELVACAETSSIALVLEDNHYNAAELPKTPIEWTEKGPFFIKLGLENTGFSCFLEKIGIRKAPPYIGMAECTEESKPKYKAVSPDSINKSNPSQMLFTMHIQHENLSLATGAAAGGSSVLLRDGANAIFGAIRPEVLAEGA